MDAEEVAQMLPEGRLQLLPADEVIGFFDAHEAAALVESGAGNQAMDVGMKPQLLVPRVEHRGEATDAGAQSLGGRQFLGK